MILGIGIDIVSIARMERVIAARGERFLRRVFSPSEVEEGAKRLRSAPYFAARFAAREAFVKALGTGFRRGVSLADIAVATGELGRPELVLGGRAAELLEGLGSARCHLSISHDGDGAQAIVILESA
jgi:holo-[acyl-carrier protein] synthase